MTWISMFQKAINYMEEHLLDDINYTDVAKAVNMSGYEFHRSFSFMTGMSANAYIRNRRLSLAGVELIKSDEKIIDIALKYGYDTPESFTKAFTRFHGVSPKYAKLTGTKLCMFNPLTIKISMEGGKIMNYRIEVTEKQKFLCCKKAFNNEIIHDEDNHEIPDFWDECYKTHLIHNMCKLRPEGKKDIYGLCSPTKKGCETFDYGIGVLIDEDTLAFDVIEMERMGCTIWQAEKQQYVVFECIGENGDCIGEAWEKFYKEFLPQTGYQSIEKTDYEIYYECGKKGMMCELWIPIEFSRL